MNRIAVVYALLSAALFGISTPAAKGLVGTVDPVLLAGLLYCGAGIGVTILRSFAHAKSDTSDVGPDRMAPILQLKFAKENNGCRLRKDP